MPVQASHSLKVLCKHYNTDVRPSHRALADVDAVAEVCKHLCQDLRAPFEALAHEGLLKQLNVPWAGRLSVPKGRKGKGSSLKRLQHLIDIQKVYTC